MDSGTIFYIIAIIAYFIYTTFIAKKVEKPIDPEDQGSDNQPVPEKGRSFDDLLKEIRKEQNEREDDLEMTGEQTFEKKEKSDSKPPISYSDIPENFSQEEAKYKNPYQELKQPLVKLDDQVDINDDTKLVGKVEDVAEEYQGRSKYADILKNPERAKDAIILSEILNRRHF